MCPYTMGGAMDMWQRYWKVQLAENTPNLAENQRRYQSYQVEINKAIAEAASKEEKKHNKSPLAVNWKSSSEV